MEKELDLNFSPGPGAHGKVRQRGAGAGKAAERTEQLHQANIRLLLELWDRQLRLVDGILHFPKMVQEWIAIQPRPKTVSAGASKKIDRGLDRITEAGLTRLAEIVDELVDGRASGFSLEPMIAERKDEVLRMCSLRVLAVREEGLGLWLIKHLRERDKIDSAARLLKFVRETCAARDAIISGPLRDEKGNDLGSNEAFVVENTRRTERLLTGTERVTADPASWCRQALIEAIEMWCPGMGDGGSNVPLAGVFRNRLMYVFRTCRTKECHSIQAPRRVHETRAKLRRLASDFTAAGLSAEEADAAAARKLVEEEGYNSTSVREAIDLPKVSSFSELAGAVGSSRESSADEERDNVENHFADDAPDASEAAELNEGLEQLEGYLLSLRPTEHLVIAALHAVQLHRAAVRWVDATADESLRDLAAATRNAARDSHFPRMSGIEVFRANR